MDLTPQVMDLLEQVRVAVVEAKHSEAERLMVRVKTLVYPRNQDKEKLMSFTEWFGRAVLGGSRRLTVPRRITQLSCGCTRRESDSLFVIHRRHLQWSHMGPGCQIPDPPKVEQAFDWNSSGLTGWRKY